MPDRRDDSSPEPAGGRLSVPRNIACRPGLGITTAWQMRLWATTLAYAFGVTGSLFLFVDRGIIAGGHGFRRFLWGFGAVAFLTVITGTRLGLPACWERIGFSYLVSAALTYATLTFVFIAVVTPLALACRLAGRHRLRVRPDGTGGWWHGLGSSRSQAPERQF